MRSPTALLLGGLNLVRALGLGRIAHVVASPQPDWPAAWSRFATGSLLLPRLERREAVVRALLDTGKRLADAAGARVPLYYGNDDYLSLVQESYGELRRFFRLLLNPPEVARALIDKERFEAFARGRGLPVPRTLAWDELAGWAHPVLVKPKVKIGYDDSAVYQRLFGGFGKARVFSSGAELAASALASQLRDDLLIQEYVRGGDRQLWSFHGYADEHGNLLAGFVGRKIRTYPVLTGQSSYLELVHDEAFAQVGRAVAERIPLRGVFKVDFKQDADTGAWYLLEINARFNLWHYLAARNGLNLPRVAYDYLVHGERPAAAAYATAYRWLAFHTDWRAYRELAARGELDAAAWLRSLAASRKVYDLFSWSDPAPFVRHWLRQTRVRAPRVGARMMRWLSTAS